MSASAPAGMPTRNTGSSVAVCTSATSVGDAERSPISHAAPTFCIIEPMFEAICAMNRARKTGWRSGAHADVRGRGPDEAASSLVTVTNPHGSRPPRPGPTARRRARRPYGSPAPVIGLVGPTVLLAPVSGQAGGAVDEVTELGRRVPDDHRGLDRARRGRPTQPVQRGQLAEVLARPVAGDHLVRPVDPLAADLHRAGLDDVHEITRVALAEEHLTRVERALDAGSLAGGDAGRQLDDAVGHRQQALVVGGDDDDAARAGQRPQEPQDALDLHVVQVSGGLVGQHEGRVGGERTGDGDALLLPARQPARAVVQPVAQVDLGHEHPRPLERAAPRHPGDEERRGDVLDRRQAGHQVEGLEDDPDRRPPVRRRARRRATR